MSGCDDDIASKQSTTFRDDMEFLRRYAEVVVLKDSTGRAQVAVVPAWQGRVMTSTNGSEQGPSFGWINYELIRSGDTLPHINPYGGEDRFWMGPEGGQFSVFFEMGDPFDLEHWQTPPCVDTEPWKITAASRGSVSFSEEASLINYSGTRFDLRIDRKVEMLEMPDMQRRLGVSISDGIEAVGFVSQNQMTNIGKEEWKKDTGLLSIWILGMYVPSRATTVVIPFRDGPEDELGPIVKDDYFGRVPRNRLQVKRSAIFFVADGEYRSKIGINPYRALGVAGSFDASRNLLTIVQYDQPEGRQDYVNSMWEIQEEPYSGDVINSYNDGPPEPGAKPMGPFYELETSSPAAGLKPRESITHLHRTYHFTGTFEQLNAIAQPVLGVNLKDIPDSSR